MTFPANPSERLPRADHNRRLGLGLDKTTFADVAQVTERQLTHYEMTHPGDDFDATVAARVGNALERLEAALPNSEPAGINRLSWRG